MKFEVGDRVAVYPMFEAIDVSNIIRLRPKPLRDPKFILDVHLGKLARYLRLLGFDSLYLNTYTDDEIINVAAKESRIILTRDRGLLKNKIVTHGYWLRSTNFKEQIKETLSRFDLKDKIKPFTRCLECNGEIAEIEKSKVEKKLPPKAKQYYHVFFICKDCKNIYWKGSHYEKMQAFIEELKVDKKR